MQIYHLYLIDNVKMYDDILGPKYRKIEYSKGICSDEWEICRMKELIPNMIFRFTDSPKFLYEAYGHPFKDLDGNWMIIANMIDGE